MNHNKPEGLIALAAVNVISFFAFHNLFYGIFLFKWTHQRILLN